MALARKRRRRRTPRGWTEALIDLHDYAGPPATRACRIQSSDAKMVVSDDWPEQVPIGDAELRVIEGHLRQELDELFGPLP